MAKRKTKKLPKVLTTEEMNRFLATFNKDTLTGFRNYVLFKFMFATGVRVSEALSCRYDLLQVSTRDSKQVVYFRLEHSKNGEQADIFIPESLYRDFSKISRMFEHKKKGLIFTTVQGAFLQGRYVRKVATDKGKKANLPISFSPHKARHTYCTTLYQKTSDIRLVQGLARHKSLDSTLVYCAIKPRAAEEVADLIEFD